MLCWFVLQRLPNLLRCCLQPCLLTTCFPVMVFLGELCTVNLANEDRIACATERQEFDGFDTNVSVPTNLIKLWTMSAGRVALPQSSK